MQDALIVLGMHRSGTSALAGALDALGVDLGRRLMPGRPGDNERGFFEHLDVFDLHSRWLRRLGHTWDDLRSLSDVAVDPVRAAELSAELRELLRRDFTESACWAVKDPRLCRLLFLWQPVLEELGCRPRYLLIHRHPAEVAGSLARRDGFSAAKSATLWLDHTLSAEAMTRGAPRTFVGYDQLLENATGTLEAIGRALDLAWPRSVEEAAEDLKRFLSFDLRHHRASDRSLGAFGEVADTLTRLYSTLEAQTLRDGRDAGDAFDRMRSEVAALQPPPELLLEHLTQVALATSAEDHWRAKEEIAGELRAFTEQLRRHAEELKRHGVVLRSQAEETQRLTRDRAAQAEELERHKAEQVRQAGRLGSLAESLQAQARELQSQGETLTRSRDERGAKDIQVQNALEFLRDQVQALQLEMEKGWASRLRRTLSGGGGKSSPGGAAKE